jgi:hypothetical protein
VIAKTDRKNFPCNSLFAHFIKDAPFQAHLLISSWGGRLKGRFDTVLSKHYESWKGTMFVEDDFTLAAQRAKKLMTSETGSKLEDVFKNSISAQLLHCQSRPVEEVL